MSYQTSLLAAGLGSQYFDGRLRGHCDKASKAQGLRGKSCVYFIEQKSEFRAVKIGVSASHDATRRMASLQGGNPHELRMVLCVPGNSEHEEMIHCILTPNWLRGEWFRFDGAASDFLETLQGQGLGLAALEYLKRVRDEHQQHAAAVRNIVKAAMNDGELYNIAFAAWGKTRKQTFEAKQVRQTLNGAILLRPVP